ncbi:STN domain-containing protein [Stenotrophomonas sp. AN71]|uniref:STN domain-containing protein n=1 Tax=Stenotrophomonas sp. AN71 TaxID=3156253 RepID=UPI003D1B132E
MPRKSLRRGAPSPGVRPLVHAMQIATFALASAGCVSAASAQAMTEPSPRQGTTEVRIAASPLGTALMRFAAASGVSLSLDPSQIQGLQAAGLSGQFTVEAGFAALLKNTDFEAVRADRGSYILHRRSTDQPSRPTARVAKARPDSPRVSELSAVTVTART